MKKIARLKELLLIPVESANHIVFGLVFFVLLTIKLDNVLSLFLTVILGFLIEIVDVLRRTKFNVYDILCTGLAGAFITLIDLIKC